MPATPNTGNNALAEIALWLAIAGIWIAGVGLSWNPTAPAQAMAAVFIACAFVHAASSYGLRDAAVLFLICNVITFAMENLAAFSGFPFGAYHFLVGTDLPHIGRVPIIVGPLWFGGGYFAWAVASILLDGADHRLGETSRMIALPLVAAFVMTQWDLAMDAPNATIARAWVWHQGGAMFGVPLSNYLGWLLTSWLFYLGFALYLRWSCPSATRSSPRLKAIAILFYVGAGLTYIVPWLMNEIGDAADGSGHVWRIRDIREATVLIFLFTMAFTSLLAALRLSENRNMA